MKSALAERILESFLVAGEFQPSLTIVHDPACRETRDGPAGQAHLPRYKQHNSFHLVAAMPVDPVGKAVRRGLAGLALTRR